MQHFLPIPGGDTRDFFFLRSPCKWCEAAVSVPIRRALNRMSAGVAILLPSLNCFFQSECTSGKRRSQRKWRTLVFGTMNHLNYLFKLPLQQFCVAGACGDACFFFFA